MLFVAASGGAAKMGSGLGRTSLPREAPWRTSLKIIVVCIHFILTSIADARYHPGRAAIALGLATLTPGIQETSLMQYSLRHAAFGKVAYTLAWEIPLSWSSTSSLLSG